MNLKLCSLTENHVREICNWKYEGEYSVYNLPTYDKVVTQKWGIAIEEKREKQFAAVRSQNGDLYGYIRFIENENYVLVGLGLKPSLCGQGLGSALMELIKKESNRRYGNIIIVLEVRSFNQRAIKCYQRAGFKIIDRYSKDTLAGHDEFIKMEFRY